MLKIFKNLFVSAENSILTVGFYERFKIVVDLIPTDNKPEIEVDKNIEVDGNIEADKETEEVVSNKVETKKKKETSYYKKEWFNDGFNSW